jgi:hypothetical protein
MILMTDLITALRISDKILLSKVQVRILSNLFQALHNPKLHQPRRARVRQLPDSEQNPISDDKEVFQHRSTRQQGLLDL